MLTGSYIIGISGQLRSPPSKKAATKITWSSQVVPLSLALRLRLFSSNQITFCTFPARAHLTAQHAPMRCQAREKGAHAHTCTTTVMRTICKCMRHTWTRWHLGLGAPAGPGRTLNDDYDFLGIICGARARVHVSRPRTMTRLLTCALLLRAIRNMWGINNILPECVHTIRTVGPRIDGLSERPCGERAPPFGTPKH